MKKIVLMPVKNEDWILEFSLSCASLWADHIIVADQNSTDRTADICKKFEKVIFINNDSQFHSGAVRHLLLEEARKIPGNNLLFSLDADEIISANFLEESIMKDLIFKISPGDSVMLQWINLWETPLSYRDDESIWSNSWKHFAFYDNREFNYDFVNLINDHSARVPGESLNHTYKNDEIKVLHFQFLGRERMLSKQRRYRVHDLIQQENSLINNVKLNIKYFPTKIKEKAGLTQVPEEWIKTYTQNNILQTNIQFISDTYWYDTYVLEKLSHFGLSYFKFLDIWDTDWNKKAKLLSVSGDFSDPRGYLIKFYHYSQKFLTIIALLVPKFIKNKL